MPTPFETFVTNELPKRPFTNDGVTSWVSGKPLVATGVGLGVTTDESPQVPVTSVNSETGDVVVSPASIGAVSTADIGDTVCELVAGQIPTNRLPSLAIVEFLGTAASQAAMLALTGQQGDWCIRADLGVVYILIDSNPTLLSSWQSLAYPAAPVTTVNGQTGAVVLGYASVGADPAGAASAAQSAAIAYSVQRSNHLGTQASSTISDFNSSVLAIADAVGAAATAQSAAQAYSVQRANHSGTQAASTISDFNSSVLAIADAAGAATSAVSAHAGAVDPHGDRAYADSSLSTRLRVDADQSLSAAQQRQARKNAGFDRSTVSVTTASINAQSYETGTLTIFRAFSILSISTDYPCRVRLYDTLAHRNNDVNRAVGTYPAEDSGCFFEFITSSTLLSAPISRAVNGFNNESPVSSIIPYTITNLDTSTRTITLNLTVLPQE